MNELNVQVVPINTLKTYKNNAKLHPKEQIEQIKRSIKEFGFNDPIAVWKDNEIIEGHGRLLACQELGIEEVPIIRLDDLDDEQRRAYMLVHNQLTMNSGFDADLLDIELDNIDMDMEQFGFVPKDETLDELYTDKTDIPQYEPTGLSWQTTELYDDAKAEELTKEITEADIDEETRKFLLKAASRHVRFNYKRIADFYANAPREVQELMEKSALVIIDYNDAIKNGYATLSEKAGEYTA